MLLAEQLLLPSSSEPQTVEQEIGQVMLAAVGALANDNSDIDDFEDVARVHGKKALRAYLATLPDPPKATEARLNWLIDWVLKLHPRFFKSAFIEHAESLVELQHFHRHLCRMRTISDALRDRLRDLESELIEIAVATHVPDEQEIAEALLAEAKRIERVANGAAQAR
jgi:hypothetical protein